MAWTVLALIAVTALAGGWLGRPAYDFQSREAIGERPSAQYPLGTDDLGRDRLSRLLYGTRVSLLLAPGAAAASLIAAALLGTLAGFLGGAWARVIGAAADLTLSLPWLFLLLTLRALLPLNAAPWLVLVVTFGILGLLGWAAPARVVLAGVRRIRDSEFMMAARARGVGPWRLFSRHLIPNMWPVLVAQFLISIPVYILAEANLGMMGLGVAESTPSWGNLLRELGQHPEVLMQPLERWEMFVPLAVMIVAVAGFQRLAAGGREVSG
jgi:peptide/nickel transport system permease protein